MKKQFIQKALLSAVAPGLLAALCFMPSCKKTSSSSVKTLYDSLGSTTMVSDPSNPGTMIEKGRLGIRSVVDSTIFVIAADPLINGHFTVLLSEVTAGNFTGFNALSKNLTDFFCQATGSKNFTYGGLSMTVAHDPTQNPRMNGKADSNDFNEFVTDLVAGAQKCGLSSDLIGRVGAIVETLEGQVVQGPNLTLYDTLGSTTMVADPSNPGTMIEKGRLGIRSVVDSTIFVIAADSRINGHFTVLLAEVTSGNLTGFSALSKNLTDFFCVATGAKDFSYTGLSMTAAHNPATNPRMNGKADSSDFNAFVADLVVGAQKCGLSSQVIGRVGAIVGTLEGQVVQQ